MCSRCLAYRMAGLRNSGFRCVEGTSYATIVVATGATVQSSTTSASVYI